MMLRILKQYYPIRNVFFLLGEGLMLFFAVFLSALIIRGYTSVSLNMLLALKVFLVTVTIQIIFYYNELYEIKTVDTFGELGIRLCQGLGFASIFFAAIYFIFPETIIGRGVFILSIGFVFVFVGVWRFGYMLILNHGLLNRKIAILGSGQISRQIIQEIRDKKDIGYYLSAVIMNNSDDVNNKLFNGINVMRSHQNLCQTAKKLDVKDIVVALDEKRGLFPIKELLECRVAGINVLDGNTFYEMLKGKLSVNAINPSWLIFSQGFHKPVYQRIIKRLLDLLISSSIMVLFSPLFVLVAILIKAESKGPTFFSQERMGEKMKPYQVLKFRSMIEDAEQHSGPMWAEEDDDRITRIGRIIRRARIDEMPQVWNVFKGEMSFVGPRPERQFFVKQLIKKIPYFQERFTVKPGITGWAQINYGYGASEEDAIEKLNYDLFYIKNMSILMDLVIIFRTVRIVLFGTGAR